MNENTEIKPNVSLDQKNIKKPYNIKTIKKLFFYTFISICIVCISYLFYRINKYGTLKFGEYYIHAWAPALNEQFFHFGKASNSEEIIEKILLTTPICSDYLSLYCKKEEPTKKVELPKEETSPNKDEPIIVKYPTINLTLPKGWTAGWFADEENNNINPKNIIYKKLPAGTHICHTDKFYMISWIITEYDCNELEELSLVSLDVEQVLKNEYNSVFVSINFDSFCEYFKDRFSNDWQRFNTNESMRWGDKCKNFDKSKFVLYKNVFLPERIFPEQPICEPTKGFENKYTSNEIKIAALTGLKQLSKTLCGWESSYELGSSYTYYLPLSGEYDGVLMNINISFHQDNPMSVQAVKEFEQALINSLEIK